MNADVATEVLKSAPPAGVTLMAAAAGLSLNNIIGAATLVYIVLQAGYLLWKWRREWTASRRNGDAID